MDGKDKVEPGHKKGLKILGITFTDEFLKNKYNHLLTLFVILFIISPFLEDQNVSVPFSGVIFFFSIVFTLRAVIDSKRLYHITIGIITVGFTFYLLLKYKLTPVVLEYHYIFLSVLSFTIALLISIHALTRKILKEEVVNNDTIKGGICLYFLIGLAYAQVYFLIFLFDPNAFSVQNIHLGDLLYFQYYSFTTLTTLGFGDITPINKIAMNISYLEAITGQMMIAVFIARLIGLNMAHEQKKMIRRIDQDWNDQSE